jgi:hypothetical protein
MIISLVHLSVPESVLYASHVHPLPDTRPLIKDDGDMMISLLAGEKSLPVERESVSSACINRGAKDSSSPLQ